MRARIIAAGAERLADGGRDALTRRAVAAAAGVQAPTIYRLFSDKRGLLEAVAEHGLAEHIAQNSRSTSRRRRRMCRSRVCARAGISTSCRSAVARSAAGSSGLLGGRERKRDYTGRRGGGEERENTDKERREMGTIVRARSGQLPRGRSFAGRVSGTSNLHNWVWFRVDIRA